MKKKTSCSVPQLSEFGHQALRLVEESSRETISVPDLPAHLYGPTP